MKHSKWVERTNDTALRFGYSLRDQSLLRQTDPAKTPTTQVFNSDIEDDTQATKYCPNCNCSLDWIDPIKQYGCKNCNTFVNEEWDKDIPLSTNVPQGLRVPLDQMGPYTTFDSQDEIPYMHSWSPYSPSGQDLSWDTTWQDNTGRVRTIRMKDGHPATEYDIIEDKEVNRQEW